MSAKSDYIDLNSDVILSETENVATGVNLSEEDCLRGQGTDLGSSMDGKVKEKSRGTQEANELVEDGGKGNLGLGERTDSEDMVICVEGKVRVGDELVDDSSKMVIDTNGNDGDCGTESIDGLEQTQKGEVLLRNGDEKEKALRVENVPDDLEKNRNVNHVHLDGSAYKGASSIVDSELNLEGAKSMHVEPQFLGTAESKAQLSSESLDVQVKAEGSESSLHRKPKVWSGSLGMVSSDGIQMEHEIGDDFNLLNIVVDLSPHSSSKKNVQLTTTRPEFWDSNLVWGKIRSHPWWPGQIFNPSASSKKAKKYFRKDSYLVAYFGDHTFAWNDPSQIKPFLDHFSQMKKQSNTVDFHDAVACALDEVTRRIEFGLACSCLSEEVYSKLKTQIIINAGIQEEYSRIDGGDCSLSINSFKPEKLLHYLKELAPLPSGEADKLEYVMTRAQLSAFYRSKGYLQLPEFSMLGGLLENDVDISLQGDKNNTNAGPKSVTQNSKGDELVPGGNGKCKRRDCNAVGGALPKIKDEELTLEEKVKAKNQDGSFLKRKVVSQDSTCPSKREKTLSEMLAEKGMRSPVRENKLGNKTSKTLVYQQASKKRKDLDVTIDASAEKRRKDSPTGDDKQSSQPRKTFSVGESIRKVASLLNGSNPILKNVAGMSKKSVVPTETEGKAMSDKSHGRMSVVREYAPNEMLSHLLLAAMDPMKSYSFLLSVIPFFSEFRNSTCLDGSALHLHESKKSTKSGNGSSENIEQPDEELMEDSKKRREQSSSHKRNEEKILAWTTGNDSTVEELQPELQSDSKEKIASENEKLVAEKPAAHLNENCTEDGTQTALILNFSNNNSVPSEVNLNKIFSQYGPLNESKTEVLKKSPRAKVVFKQRSDAETAFSSAGKYSIFGPSLVSYRLKYLPSTPMKSSSHVEKK